MLYRYCTFGAGRSLQSATVQYMLGLFRARVFAGYRPRGVFLLLVGDVFVGVGCGGRVGWAWEERGV